MDQDLNNDFLGENDSSVKAFINEKNRLVSGYLWVQGGYLRVQGGYLSDLGGYMDR